MSTIKVGALSVPVTLRISEVAAQRILIAAEELGVSKAELIRGLIGDVFGVGEVDILGVRDFVRGAVPEFERRTSGCSCRCCASEEVGLNAQKP